MAVSKSPSQSNLSTRISLRWLPEAPFENTDTLVCQVGEWYVDLRVDKGNGALDWALAGQYLSEGENPRMALDTWARTHLREHRLTATGHVTFTHEIDSNHNFNVSQPCPFTVLSNGDDLETGTMGRPDKPGAPATDYEEVWRYLSLHEGPGGPGHGISWILESDNGVLREGQNHYTKTFLARIGDAYLVMQQDKTHTITRTAQGEWTVKVTGGDVSARREHFDHGWKEIYALGPRRADLPSMVNGLAGESEGPWCIPGRTINVLGQQYVVRAFERWGLYRARL